MVKAAIVYDRRNDLLIFDFGDMKIFLDRGGRVHVPGSKKKYRKLKGGREIFSFFVNAINCVCDNDSNECIVLNASHIIPKTIVEIYYYHRPRAHA